MHEMAMAESVLQIVEETARKASADRVAAVWLEIGQLAQIEIEAMRFCFDAVTRNTIAENAALHIVDVCGEAWCMKCSNAFPVRSRTQSCPECGSHQLQIGRGTEMRVKEIEVA